MRYQEKFSTLVLVTALVVLALPTMAYAGPGWLEDEDEGDDNGEPCVQPDGYEDYFCPPDELPASPSDCWDWLVYDIWVCEHYFQEESKRARERIDACVTRFAICVNGGNPDCLEKLEACIAYVPVPTQLNEQLHYCQRNAFDDYQDCQTSFATDPGDWGDG